MASDSNWTVMSNAFEASRNYNWKINREENKASSINRYCSAHSVHVFLKPKHKHHT